MTRQKSHAFDSKKVGRYKNAAKKKRKGRVRFRHRNRERKRNRRARLFTVPLFFRGILETGTLRWNRHHLGL